MNSRLSQRKVDKLLMESTETLLKFVQVYKTHRTRVFLSKKYLQCGKLEDRVYLERRARQLFQLTHLISDIIKYDITWTENSDVIDGFIPEILFSKRGENDSLRIFKLLRKNEWNHFCYYLHVNISGL